MADRKLKLSTKVVMSMNPMPEARPETKITVCEGDTCPIPSRITCGGTICFAPDAQANDRAYL